MGTNRLWLAALCVVSMAMNVSAVTWGDGSLFNSDWTDDANWNGGAQPGSTDSAVFGYSTGDPDGEVNNSGAQCGVLYLGYAWSATNHTLDVNSGGELKVNSSGYVGYQEGDHGTLNISGGVVTNDGDNILYFGRGDSHFSGTPGYPNSTGILNMSGGNMYLGGGSSADRDLVLGYYSNAVGSATISGGELTVNGHIEVGYYIGSEGTMVITNTGRVTSHGGYFVLGESGSGTLAIDGGVGYLDQIRMGKSSSGDGSGTMYINGGVLTNRYYTYVGLYGNGEVVQTGGDWVLGTPGLGSQHGLVLGYYAGNASRDDASGYYEISGGSITVNSATHGISVGRDGGGTGTFKVIGANATISTDYYNQSTNGTLVAEVNGDGISVINASTNAVISGTLEIIDSGAVEGTYDIITAANGVSGTFDTIVVPDSTWGVIYGANTVSVFKGNPTIISIASAGSGVVEMVADVPAPSVSRVLKRADLVSGGWGYEGYSTNGLPPFTFTTLDDASDSGAYKVIYLQTTDNAAFYGIGE